LGRAFSSPKMKEITRQPRVKRGRAKREREEGESKRKKKKLAKPLWGKKPK